MMAPTYSLLLAMGQLIPHLQSLSSHVTTP